MKKMGEDGMPTLAEAKAMNAEREEQCRVDLKRILARQLTQMDKEFWSEGERNG